MNEYNNKLVKKHNDLIQKTINNMTYEENKIINILLAKYKNAKTDKVIDSELTANELCELMEIKTREPNTMENIGKAIASINSKANLLWITEEKTTAIGYFSKIEFEHNTGIIKFKWNEEIKKYLDDIQKQFTLYNIDYYKLLNSKNSQILYELMKSFEKMPKCPKTYTSVEELRKIFDIKENTYKTYHLLKTNVIDRAVKEINKKTDIIVSYEQRKKGRNVVGLYWFVEPKEEQPKAETTKETTAEPRQNNKKYGKKPRIIEQIPDYDKANNDSIEISQETMNKYLKQMEERKTNK